MSKTKKKVVEEQGALSAEDIKFEKIIQFSGWMFLLALILFMGAWVVLDFLLDLVEFKLDASTFSFIIFMGTNAALSFALSYKIRNNRDQKRKFFVDWLIGIFLFSMFAIFAVAVYQW